jgi:hypothetical protein
MQIEGQRFGFLTVLSFSHVEEELTMWKCRCDCGKETVVRGVNLRNGGTKSCGCFVAIATVQTHVTHGESYSHEYRSWKSMKQRCFNPVTTSYSDYGGMGITVCARWGTSYESFKKDMGAAPTPQHSIDRWPNKQGNYSCGECEECLRNGWVMNCRWATTKEQNNNLRTNRILEFNGMSKNVTQWAEHLGIKPYILHQRLWRKWAIEEALTTPVGPPH